MDKRTNSPWTVLTVVAVAFTVLVGLIALAGCKEEAPTMHDHTQHMSMPEHALADQPAADAVVVEQTTCPVMGGPVNKAIYTEYKGKKVYFCCNGCDEQFQADPEKYIAKLPQFQQVGQ